MLAPRSPALSGEKEAINPTFFPVASTRFSYIMRESSVSHGDIIGVTFCGKSKIFSTKAEAFDQSARRAEVTSLRFNE